MIVHAEHTELADTKKPVLLRPLVICALATVAVAVYWPSAKALYSLWTDLQGRGYTHGLAVAAVSVWLIFRDRGRIASAAVRFSPLACAALLASSVAWLICWHAAIQAFHLLMFVGLIWLAVFAAFGWSVAALAAFPIGYLYFALPIWTPLSGLLQHLTIDAVRLLATLTGLPAQIEGTLVRVPEGVFEVASGCSGLQMFVAGLAVAALQGQLGYEAPRVRIKRLALMAILTLVCNWVRVFTIVVAGHLTDMKHYLVTVDHYFFGWVLFGGTLAVFMWMTRRWPTSGSGKYQRSPGECDAVSPAACVTAAVALSIVPLSAYSLERPSVRAAAPAAAVLPPGAGGWAGPLDSGESRWQPAFTGASERLRAVYADSAGRSVEVFAVIYEAQRQSAKLVSYANAVAGEEGVAIEDERVISVGGASFRQTVLSERNGWRAVIWWVYDIDGRAFVNPLKSQLWYGIRSLTGPRRASLRAFRAECRPGCDGARRDLSRFVELMDPQIRSALGRSARAQR